MPNPALHPRCIRPRLAEALTDSLANRSSDEQEAVKTAAFDQQLNPAR